MPGHVDPTRESFAAFREARREGPVHMLDLLRFRDRAAHDDGTECSGADACRLHGRESAPVFRRLRGRQIRIGRPELMPIGPGSERWNLAFIAMLRDPDDRRAFRHPQAAVEASRLIRMEPAEPGASFGEARA